MRSFNFTFFPCSIFIWSWVTLGINFITACQLVRWGNPWLELFLQQAGSFSPAFSTTHWHTWPFIGLFCRKRSAKLSRANKNASIVLLIQSFLLFDVVPIYRRGGLVKQKNGDSSRKKSYCRKNGDPKYCVEVFWVQTKMLLIWLKINLDRTTYEKVTNDNFECLSDDFFFLLLTSFWARLIPENVHGK